jgi:benzoyl-CoA reductase subunit BamC
MACSGFHAVPKFSSVNPARSRIRVMVEDRKDVYVPIRAGDYAQAECNGRNSYTIDGKEYSQCCFCTASCPARDLFKEPDSGLPLKCDMCADDPTLTEPMCVQVCRCGALTYLVHEEEVKTAEYDMVTHSEMSIGLESLVHKFGYENVADAFELLSKGKKRGVACNG